ncbi:hypothetical protein G9A89_023762 [Geosiphon pyriformis]|nr:hypothetical protein G9A89_023762 [Geosiphon pyriformis]
MTAARNEITRKRFWEAKKPQNWEHRFLPRHETTRAHHQIQNTAHKPCQIPSEEEESEGLESDLNLSQVSKMKILRTNEEIENRKVSSLQLEFFKKSYQKMKQCQKWVLASGICVEDILLKHCI